MATKSRTQRLSKTRAAAAKAVQEAAAAYVTAEAVLTVIEEREARETERRMGAR